MQYSNLHIFVWASIAYFTSLMLSFSKSITFLMFCFVPALLFFIHVLAPRSFTYLLSFLAFVFYFKTFTSLLSFLVSDLVFGSSAYLLSILVLNLALFYLASLVLKIFKETLSDKLLYCRLTSSAEFFYLFSLYSLLFDKTDCKQVFDIAFINFCLFVGNYA